MIIEVRVRWDSYRTISIKIECCIDHYMLGFAWSRSVFFFHLFHSIVGLKVRKKVGCVIITWEKKTKTYRALISLMSASLNSDHPIGRPSRHGYSHKQDSWLTITELTFSKICSISELRSRCNWSLCCSNWLLNLTCYKQRHYWWFNIISSSIRSRGKLHVTQLRSSHHVFFLSLVVLFLLFSHQT